MMSTKIRTKTRRPWVLLAILCASVTSLLLVARFACFATDESLIRIVVTRGNVKITGTGSPRIIDRAGDVHPGEWAEPSQGSIAYLIRDSGFEKLSAAKRTRIMAESPSTAFTPERRSLLDHITALFLPKEEYGQPAITKGGGEGQAGNFRVLYPRDSKVADREPVFAWVGGGDRFEVRLYRSGVDEWVWRQEVRGQRRTTLSGHRLEDGKAYVLEVRDLQNPENIDMANFETPTRPARRRLENGVREIRASCRSAAASSVTCELAVAGLYRREGYLYDAIRALEAIRPSGQHATGVENLLKDLQD